MDDLCKVIAGIIAEMYKFTKYAFLSIFSILLILSIFKIFDNPSKIRQQNREEWTKTHYMLSDQQ